MGGQKLFQINVGFGSRVHDFLDFSECQKKGPGHLAPSFGDPGNFLDYLRKLEKKCNIRPDLFLI